MQAQRSLPKMETNAIGGSGVMAQRAGLGISTEYDDPGGLPSSQRWGAWFDALARRLKQVIILNSEWTSAVTPAALAARAGGIVAVLLDPPYVTAGRAKLYDADADAEKTNRVARESYEWALKHGDEYRVAYCHTAGSFAFPDGWEVLTKRYTGANDEERTVDAIAFSPKCIRPGRDSGQLGMFR